MKKTISLFLVLPLLFTVFTANENRVFAEEGPQQVIVKYKENSQSAAAEAQSANLNNETDMAALEVPAGKTAASFMQELKAKGDVEFVEPDYRIELAYTPNDPEFAKLQYHHKKVGTAAAWKQTKGSADVVVAVIDDGMDLLHAELANQFIAPYDALNKQAGTISPGFHGTHVAGLIAGSADNGIWGAGVAPHTKIMPIDVFDDGGFAYTSDLIHGIEHAIASNVDIINMSLGSYYYSKALDQAIQQAHKEGIVIVAAAGNDGTRSAHYPSSLANVISVGAVTNNDTSSLFSNKGPSIDVTAPGTEVYSSLPNNLFGPLSGTSMAAPIVSGVAALIKADQPSLSNKEIEKLIFSSSDDLGKAGRDDVYGHGRVNAKKALKN
ncbi:subtilisin family serine protease [Planomicrobium stackebrandtii]|uniref:Subtilisin family serine protease n=1 Tax=Planomicrobium stackebrandtii TaxID=253160 RepID=A0ABU0GU62_9BACL|nr:S8 family serine peptidase [Planomicrobium stackebrandtii]MDQ0428896.1 subtilisin family serine protease [Planomicrobium stackebrandtii]